MNKKRYSQGYAQILDIIASMQVPDDLDLAPDILTRIQQRKGFRMQPRMKLFSAAALVVIVLVILFSTVPGMAAGISRIIERWFGYVPGIGFVHQGQIRALDHPVSLTREGVTVTVDQVVLDPERTTLVYSVEGIPSAAIITRPEDQHCPYAVSLRLPDGSTRLASPNGIQAWASGYQQRFYYPPMPDNINDAMLVISCLFNTREGAAPENWEIPLHFTPATPNMTAFPVIEIATPTITAATPPQSTTLTATETTPALSEASQAPVSMSLILDRAVQMDDGYLIYATVHWKDTPFASVDVTEPTQTLHLLDASGQPMLYEFRYDDTTGVNVDQRQTVFAIKTAPVQATGPLTLVLDSLSVNLPANTRFVFDPGAQPKPGQTWPLNQDILVGPYHLRVKTATAETGGYSFEMSSDNGIQNAVLADFSHPIASGGGGGGGGSPDQSFFSSVNYAGGQLPGGPLTISVTAIEIRHNQRLDAQWTPPAISTHQIPTQAAACLTSTSWKAAVAQRAANAQKPVLPDGIGGRVLTSGLDKNGNWGLTISNLDGSNPVVIDAAQDGSFSPDGSKLAYSTLDQGITILNLGTGQASHVPGTGHGDFNPVWSPDGQQLVFNRGMGIFDLFIVETDGSNMRQITHGGVQEWPVGWMPDGRLLYTVPGRENEYISYAVDLQNGKTDVVSESNAESISPDGRYILTSEKTFGDRWLLYVSDLDGANRWLLNDASLWALTPVWSSDGQWLLAGVSNTDPGSTTGALINLRTCQVISLPNLKGSFLSWAP